MIATTATTTPYAPAKFARVVAALVRQFAGLVVGAEWVSGLALGWDVEMWAPKADHLSLALCPVEEDGSTGAAVRRATIVPGQYRAWEVVADGIVLGEFHGLDAAVSHALDHVAVPCWAPVQHDHDAFAV